MSSKRLLLTAAVVLLLAAVAAAQGFTLEQVMSSPFPDNLTAAEQAGRVAQDIPTNHNPAFAPVIHPTMETGVEAITAAALDVLG